jgi:hypothetical protein
MTMHMQMDAKLFESLLEVQEPIVLLTPMSTNCLLCWANDAFRNQFGWSFGEVVGHEIFFLHGDGANMIPLAKRFKELEMRLCDIVDIDQRVYSMDGSLADCKVTLFPVMDPPSPATPTSVIAFIGIKFTSVTPCWFPQSLLDPFPRIFEVGLPTDRREYCKKYFDYYGKPSERNCIFSASHFKKFCGKASLTNVFSLMMATPDSMLVCDR